MIARCSRAAAFLFLLIALIPSGCTQRVGGPTVRPSADAPEDPTGPLITEEESAQFAESFTKAVQAKDRPALAALMDWDALLEAATDGFNVPEKAKQRLIGDFKGDAKKPGVLSQPMLELVERGASCTFLRRHQVEGRERLLFRLVLPDGGGVNYHDVVLERGGDGGLKGSDIYIFTNGEFLSQTARRAYMLALLRLVDAPQARLRGVEREYVQHFAKVQTMNRLVHTGDYAQVLTLYDQLPPALQDDKNVLLMRLKAAQNVGPQEYSEAIANFRAFHPTDPCVDLFSIPYFLQAKQPAKALEMVDRVEKTLGGDPYMHVLRSTIHLEANDAAAARKAAELAIAEEPTLQEAYWACVAVTLLEKKFDETLRRLREIDEKFAPKFPDFAALPEYAEFVKSPQYQEWRKSRREK